MIIQASSNQILHKEKNKLLSLQKLRPIRKSKLITKLTDKLTIAMCLNLQTK